MLDFAVLDVHGRHRRELGPTEGTPARRRLADFDGVPVHYAATDVEVRTCRADPVAVVGGGKSAGQAALHWPHSRPRDPAGTVDLDRHGFVLPGADAARADNGLSDVDGSPAV